ncbi:DUF397 domain-containing protein [Streptomyces sp. NPDC001928]
MRGGRRGEGRVLTRDSKKPKRAPLHFTGPAWTEFLHALAQGELDGP